LGLLRDFGANAVAGQKNDGGFQDYWTGRRGKKLGRTRTVAECDRFPQRRLRHKRPEKPDQSSSSLPPGPALVMVRLTPAKWPRRPLSRRNLFEDGAEFLHPFARPP
jgi:hypothetical protein